MNRAKLILWAAFGAAGMVAMSPVNASAPGPMALPQANPQDVHELFVHVRSVVGVIIGLSIGRLLQGLAGIIEHPREQKLWWVHLGWVLWAMIFVISFWWWEFHLSKVTDWTIWKYFFLFSYAGLYFLLCTILFPASLKDYSGYQEYLISRRHWFFGFIAVIAIFDLGDGLMKGSGYVHALGIGYPIHIALLLALTAAGALARRPALHGIILVIALVELLGWTVLTYDHL